MEENNHEQLEKILHSISQDAKPDKNFEQMLKVKLREKFHEEYEVSKAPFFSKIWRFKTQLVSTLVLVLFSSTTLYAYNSDSVTNGSLLYPLKKSTENVEGLFAITPQAKTEHYNKLAKRRMRELVVIEKRGMKDEETIKETNKLLSIATTIAMEVPDEDMEENDEVNEIREVRKVKKVEEREIAPIRTAAPARPTAPAATIINLAKEESPAPMALVKTSNRKTKRDKALEETSKIREEFEDRFEKKPKRREEIQSPIQEPIEIELLSQPEISLPREKKIEPKQFERGE